MRDYAKKSPQSFQKSNLSRSFNAVDPSQEPAMAGGPRLGSMEENNSNPESAKNNLIKFGIILLVILLAGFLLAQMIYKHHQAQINPAQANNLNTQNISNQTNDQANTPINNTPPKPAFDFYNSLSNPSSNNPANNPNNSQAKHPAENHAPVISLPESKNKIIQAPVISNSPNNFNNSQNTQTQNTQAPAVQNQNLNNQNNLTPASATPASNPTSNQANNTQTQYMIQVGAYRNKDEARSMQARLLLLGLHPSVSSTDSGWYRVNLGPYSAKNSAELAKHKLQNARINSAVIKPKN